MSDDFRGAEWLQRRCVDLNETIHATFMSTINHDNNVLVLLLVHRGAVTGDRKWRRKQIYSHFEGLYRILVKISGNLEISSRKFPERLE